MVILLIVSIILFFLSVDFVVAAVQRRRFHRMVSESIQKDAASWHIQGPPAKLQVCAAHVWLADDESDILRLGTDGFANAILGGIERILPKATVGKVQQGAPLTALMGEGRTLTLRAPVDGEIIEHNTKLDPKALAENPFGEAWLVRFRPTQSVSDNDGLRSGESLKHWWQEEFLRLRELAMTACRPIAAVGQTLHDGSAPVVGGFQHLDAVAWSELEHSTFGVQSAAGSPAPVELVAAFGGDAP